MIELVELQDFFAAFFSGPPPIIDRRVYRLKVLAAMKPCLRDGGGAGARSRPGDMGRPCRAGRWDGSEGPIRTV